MSKKPINRSQARSMVISTRGIVASEHPIASRAGVEVLEQGGHAVDAAIAANAVMGVVCPMMCGIGGDLFAIVSAPGGTIDGVNASGWAPAALSADLVERFGHAEMPQSGVHSVTVPGAVAGWALLHEKFGRVAWPRLFERAAAAAEDGFPVAEITAEEWGNQVDVLRADEEAAKTFLPGGRAPATGEIFRNAGLAACYRDIAAGGADAFYRGSIAARIVAGLERRGGVMAAADLTAFRAEWASPVSCEYRGWQVFELPPNGAGIAALMMLNLLEPFPLAAQGHNSADALHTLIEAKKLAYADMLRHVADPRFSDVPVDALLSRPRARDRSALIDPARAAERVEPGRLPAHAGDTVYLCTVDRAGNMVSLIQSNFASFGSGVVAEGTGFALQNRGALFTLDRTHPNALAPRKRPLHTIIPALMRRGRTRVAFGIMGGWNQSQAHAQFVSNVVDHGMNIQAALEAPRFTKLSFDGVDVAIESRVPPEMIDALRARGHDVDVQGAFCSLMGGGQAVLRDDESGVNYGASDPRKDGAAISEI